MIRGLLAVALLSVVSSQSALATNLYWDSNGVTAGAGTAPTGTWGVDNFWNSDSTGGAGGSFTTTTTGSDLVQFSAGPTVASSGTATYAVTVSGVQSALGLNFRSIGSVTLNGGTINLGTSGISMTRTVVTANDRLGITINSDLVLGGNQTFAADSTTSGFFIVNGSITGTGNLLLSQAGNRALTLAGPVNQVGTLTVGPSNPVGTTISGNIGSNVTNFLVNGSAPAILTGSNAYSGTTTIQGGSTTTARIRVGNNSALPVTTVVNMNATVASSGTLDLSNVNVSYNATVAGLNTTGGNVANNFVTNNDTTTGFAHTATLTVNPDGAGLGAADSTFNGVILDGATSRVALAKAGSHKLTLGGVNTYTGATTISGGGTLAFVTATNNNIANSASIVVGATSTLDVSAVSGAGGFALASGQTLSGFGTIAGLLTVGSGATLAPGASPGTLTFNNDLTLASGSTSTFEINGFTGGLYDLALGGAGTQNAAFDGTLNLTFSPGFNTVGSVKIFDFDTYSGAFALVNPTGLASGFTAFFNNSTGLLSVTAVPEPSTIALLVAGIAFAGVSIRRRRG